MKNGDPGKYHIFGMSSEQMKNYIEL